MLIIIKDNKLMLLTRANPGGGRPLQGYPMYEDEETGLWGYKLGYCDCGCNKPIGIRTIDIRQVMCHFGVSMEEYEEWKNQIIKKPRRPLRIKIIEFLGGKVGDEERD